MKSAKTLPCILLALALLAGCSAPAARVAETEAAAALLTQNSDFAGHALLETYSGSPPPGYEARDYNPMDHGPPPFFAYPQGTHGADSDIYGEYLPYPAGKNAFRLRLLSLRSGSCHLLGIRAGSTAAEVAGPILEEYGFADVTQEETGVNGEDLAAFKAKNGRLYQLHDLYVVLQTQENSDVITEIRIFASDPARKKADVMY